MVHIFDVDNTVIKKTSTGYFLREAISLGIIRIRQIKRLPFELIKYKLGHPDMDFIEQAVKHIAGIEKEKLDFTAERCFDHRMKPAIFTGTADLIRNLIAGGEKVIFATSSFHTIINPLQRYFGIEESIASSLEFSNGKTTGRLLGDSLFGAKKKNAVMAWLGKNNLKSSDACFYSDSYTDLPLLEFCGCQKVINPDRFLKKEAKKHGWKILYFKGCT